jgi:DNA-binding NarL/FixJ family response regulator
MEAGMPSPQKRILIADAHPTMASGVRLLLKDLFEVSVMVADVPSLSYAVVGEWSKSGAEDSPL